MNDILQNTSSLWVKFSEYEYRENGDGILYLTPAPDAKPVIYDPMENIWAIVVDMLNVGRLGMGRAGDETRREKVFNFVSKYGLLGFMTGLPTTPKFIDYEAVYLPANHFIKEEALSTEEYLEYFFPFEKLDFTKNGVDSVWNLSYDREMTALAMAFGGHRPQAMVMGFQREYAERYDWLVTQFRDWAFTYTASYLYYEDMGDADEATLNLYRQGMEAFGGIAPTYKIALLDKPTIVWDFHSLLLGLQMMFSFMLTDEKSPLRTCKHCMKIFAAKHPNAVFCSPRCKNQYNVYKSRGKKTRQ